MYLTRKAVFIVTVISSCVIYGDKQGVSYRQTLFDTKEKAKAYKNEVTTAFKTKGIREYVDEGDNCNFLTLELEDRFGFRTNGNDSNSWVEIFIDEKEIQ